MKRSENISCGGQRMEYGCHHWRTDTVSKQADLVASRSAGALKFSPNPIARRSLALKASSFLTTWHLEDKCKPANSRAVGTSCTRSESSTLCTSSTCTTGFLFSRIDQNWESSRPRKLSRALPIFLALDTKLQYPVDFHISRSSHPVPRRSHRPYCAQLYNPRDVQQYDASPNYGGRLFRIDGDLVSPT
jgi:hypothetical protein